MGKKQFSFFQTAETGNRTPDSGVKGSGANHYPRAPALERREPRVRALLWLSEKHKFLPHSPVKIQYCGTGGGGGQ